MAPSSSPWVAERRAAGVLHRNGTPRGAPPCSRGETRDSVSAVLVVTGCCCRERGGGWGPEELPENQGAADQQCGDVDRDDGPVNAQRVVEHAVTHRLDDRV